MRPEREVDLILMLDASAGLQGAPQLVQARGHAEAKKAPFVDISAPQVNQIPFRLLSGIGTPKVAYYPLVKNEGHSSFDPSAGHSFMRTSNFEYTPEQAMLVSELARFNVASSMPALRKELYNIYLMKRSKRRKTPW